MVCDILLRQHTPRDWNELQAQAARRPLRVVPTFIHINQQSPPFVPAQHPHTPTGCAGCFSAFAGLELYAEVFESLGALDKFEAFTSRHGARFYGLPSNDEKLTLVRRPWRVPDSLPLGGGAEVVPLKAGQEIAWAVKEYE
jgi:dihydroorotase